MRKVAAAAGIVGPLLFTVVVTSLSILQYGFMRSLGWDPILRPTFDWPSGLALGPLGWIMTLTFPICGILLSVFAWALRHELHNRFGRIGAMLIIWSGVAMLGLAFSTDPTIAHLPATWHGRLHDLSFLVLGLTLIPAIVLLAIAFRQIKEWRSYSPLTWFTCALAIPTFALKGLVFYAFLLSMLAWSLLVAAHLPGISQGGWKSESSSYVGSDS